MPTYDYRCNACGHEFEQFQSMKDNPIRKCPSCGRLKLERLIGTGAAIVFKGSGFYQTDYRSESYKKGAEAEQKPASSAGSGGDGAKPPEPKAATASSEGGSAAGSAPAVTPAAAGGAGDGSKAAKEPPGGKSDKKRDSKGGKRA